MDLNILYEDMDILVCEKKPGVPVQSDKTLDYDLVNQLRNHCHQKNPGKEPYIGLVHRLDRPVGGIMAFAKTPFAAKELSKQIQEQKMQKTYYCIVTKDLSQKIGQEKTLLSDYLEKNQRNNVSTVVKNKTKNSKKAELYYEVLDAKENLSLIRVELLTGRHHQIRVQMAHHLAGIWGDTKYKSSATDEKGNWKNIALFSNSLSFIHPKTKKSVSFHLNPQGGIWETFETSFSYIKLKP